MRQLRRALLAWSWRAAGVLLILGLAGLLVAASGLIPIRASSGHWALTEHLLQFAKRRSVSTHSTGTGPVSLAEPWLVLKGAGHYETGCKPCHGAPGSPTPVVAKALLPVPPDLAHVAAEWSPQELFYIVKHGLKFTGMPAWPALARDDEVRSLVAFLLELPKLDANGYRRLVHGEPSPPTASRAPAQELAQAPPPAVTASCARCHGARGEGRGNAAFPKLAGQSREYLFNALEAYAKARRHSGIMQPIAAALSPEEWNSLATYYAKLSNPSLASRSALTLQSERGREIAERGIRGQGVPSCVDCHGPGPEPRNPAYPRLAGQYADYLVLQLELLKAQQRGGSPYVHIMHNVASRLRPEQIQAVARFYASLPPGPELPPGLELPRAPLKQAAPRNIP
jgi:cytochrome c553